MKISVIVPVYRAEKYLNRCVDSILAQTFTDFELILVDDGSPDNCGAICDEYAGKDSRINVIHQKNGGLSSARNAGIDWAFANSDSEWLSFIDSDDWVHPKYLEALYGAAQRSHSEVVIGGFERTGGENPDVDESKLQETLWNVEQFYCEQNVTATVAWGKLYKREFFRNIRYPVGKIHEDEFTTYKLLFQVKKIAYVDQPLYAYYINSESIMGVGWNPKRLIALDAYAERIEWFKDKHFPEIYQWTLEKYVYYIIAAQEKVEKLPDLTERKKYQRQLEKRLGRTLIHYRKDLPISKICGAYEIAFPRFMKCYWLFQAVKRRMIR